MNPAIRTNPKNPKNPMNPMNPANPVNPANPTNPASPADPMIRATPANHVEPPDPMNPTSSRSHRRPRPRGRRVTNLGGEAEGEVLCIVLFASAPARSLVPGAKPSSRRAEGEGVCFALLRVSGIRLGVSVHLFRLSAFCYILSAI